MKILVKTLFDCSITGTTGNFRSSQLPFRDKTNAVIDNEISWTRSRNRQRNWETLLQVLGLRSQIENLTVSEYRDGFWQFCFEVENPAVYGSDGTLKLLLQDCDGVPMLDNISELPRSAELVSQGPQQNIWFQKVNT